MRKNKEYHIVLCNILLILFCIATDNAQAKIKIEKWKTIFPGIQHARGQADKNEPRLQKVNALRIDLHNPQIRFFSTPSNGSLPKETISQTTGDFLVQYKMKVAINANHYWPCCNRTPEPKDIRGLAISEGKIVSPPPQKISDGYAASLLITKDNHAQIKYVSQKTDLSNIWTAVSGRYILVQNGVNIAKSGAVHPRTAVGISKDNRYLIMITIDGRQKGYSEGSTDKETADWLIRFGAYNGLNLDGGGSTTMAASDGKGGYILLNRPIAGAGVGHSGTPGQQRLNGNNLGVYLVNTSKSTCTTKPKKIKSQ